MLLESLYFLVTGSHKNKSYIIREVLQRRCFCLNHLSTVKITLLIQGDKCPAVENMTSHPSVHSPAAIKKRNKGLLLRCQLSLSESKSVFSLSFFLFYIYCLGDEVFRDMYRFLPVLYSSGVKGKVQLFFFTTWTLFVFLFSFVSFGVRVTIFRSIQALCISM